MVTRLMRYLEERLAIDRERLAFDQEFLRLRREESAINAEHTRLCIAEMVAKNELKEARAEVENLRTRTEWLEAMIVAHNETLSRKGASSPFKWGPEHGANAAGQVPPTVSTCVTRGSGPSESTSGEEK